MIYLFEDVQNRIDKSLIKTLENESAFIRHELFDCTLSELDQYIIENFNDSKCVIFHKSYIFPQYRLTTYDVKKTFLNKGVPFVFFSGGLKNNLLKQSEVYTGTINSKDMYNNLNNFISNYKTSRKINIPLLIWGKEYLISSLKELQHRIQGHLFSTKRNEKIDLDLLDEIIDDVEVRIREPEFINDKQKLLDWLKTYQRLTPQLILEQIQKLIEKH